MTSAKVKKPNKRTKNPSKIKPTPRKMPSVADVLKMSNDDIRSLDGESTYRAAKVLRDAAMKRVRALQKASQGSNAHLYALQGLNTILSKGVPQVTRKNLGANTNANKAALAYLRKTMGFKTTTLRGAKLHQKNMYENLLGHSKKNLKTHFVPDGYVLKKGEQFVKDDPNRIYDAKELRNYNSAWSKKVRKEEFATLSKHFKNNPSDLNQMWELFNEYKEKHGSNWYNYDSDQMLQDFIKHFSLNELLTGDYQKLSDNIAKSFHMIGRNAPPQLTPTISASGLTNKSLTHQDENDMIMTNRRK